ncbi:collagen alpha-2(I) chain-like [Camarhynchus parvulus]|uniref:collagen alpha-2(I) chain-like n=1 Tax=Geospiza parvula TaxID=87175 RepID=UPI001238233D|nr:collagen alpha-2(I) chain-like [Camarhynchus parvulus]
MKLFFLHFPGGSFKSNVRVREGSIQPDSYTQRTPRRSGRAPDPGLGSAGVPEEPPRAGSGWRSSASVHTPGGKATNKKTPTTENTPNPAGLEKEGLPVFKELRRGWATRSIGASAWHRRVLRGSPGAPYMAGAGGPARLPAEPSPGSGCGAAAGRAPRVLLGDTRSGRDGDLRGDPIRQKGGP